MATSPLLLVVCLQAAFIICPGPDFALVLRTVGKVGKLAGILTAAGIALGCLMLLTLSLFGLGTLIKTIPAIYDFVRLTGAGWLLWQAVISFLPHLRKEKSSDRKASSLVQGFLNHILNIEVILFYMAVISQVDAYPISLILKAIASIEMSLFTFLWFGFLSLVASKIPSSENILNHLFSRIVLGVLFLISAIELVNIG